MNLISRVLLVCIVGMSAYSDAGAQEFERRKLAQTGMKFLSVSPDARAAGMGDAVTALSSGSTAMFYNPSGMAHTDNTFHAAVGIVQWIGDIDFSVASLAFRPLQGSYGVFGLTILSVNYGDIQETIRADNESGYQDIGTFSPSAMVAGLGYANQITDRFSVGANIKYVRESLGSSVLRQEGSDFERRDYSENTIVLDFGILYETAFRSLIFAMSVRNLSQEVTYVRESFELPLTFGIGAAMNLADFADVDPSMHSFILSVDAKRPRDYEEQIKVGGEYLFMEVLALRAGYTYPTDVEGASLGAGIQSTVGRLGFSLNYAFSYFGAFGNVNRVGAQLSF